MPCVYHTIPYAQMAGNFVWLSMSAVAVGFAAALAIGIGGDVSVGSKKPEREKKHSVERHGARKSARPATKPSSTPPAFTPATKIAYSLTPSATTKRRTGGRAAATRANSATNSTTPIPTAPRFHTKPVLTPGERGVINRMPYAGLAGRRARRVSGN